MLILIFFVAFFLFCFVSLLLIHLPWACVSFAFISKLFFAKIFVQW